MYWLVCDEVYEIFMIEKKIIGINLKFLLCVGVNVLNIGIVW